MQLLVPAWCLLVTLETSLCDAADIGIIIWPLAFWSGAHLVLAESAVLTLLSLPKSNCKNKFASHLGRRYQCLPARAARAPGGCALQGHGKLGEECFLDLVHSHQLPVELEDHGSCIIWRTCYVVARVRFLAARKILFAAAVRVVLGVGSGEGGARGSATARSSASGRRRTCCRTSWRGPSTSSAGR